MNFVDLTSNELVETLAFRKITTPTPIQQLAIPKIKTGSDIIMKSQTGSGKTIAYLLPIVENLDLDSKYIQSIIAAPSHELASQIFKQVSFLLENTKKYKNCTASLIIGGANSKRQLEQLKQKPSIIVGSVGRMLDFYRQRKFKTHFVKTIVIDEWDRMLSPQNLDQVKALVKTTMKDRQLVFVSASFSDNLLNVAKEMSKQLEIIDASNMEKVPSNIKHIYFNVEDRDKVDMIRQIYAAVNKEKIIVFFKNPKDEQIEIIAKKLAFHNIPTKAIYGEIKKNDRRNIITDFINGVTKVLICSDFVSRGLDFEDLAYIINYNVPYDSDLYLHRSGRCGRAGRNGVAISLVSKYEMEDLAKIEKKCKVKIKLATISFGKIED